MKEKWSSDRWYKALYLWLIASAFLLVISNIFALVALPLLGITTPSFEGACIQNIISILGIAVSVWVGILVVDRLDHKEIRNLSEKAKEIEASVQATEEQTKKIKKQQELNEQLSLQLLLGDLEANKNNPITQWIRQKIEDIGNHSLPSILWTTFREEEYFYRQMQQHKKDARAEEIKEQYKSRIKKINEIIEQCKEDPSVKNIKDIIALREAEFEFLLGYMRERSNKKEDKKWVTSFITAVKYYEENFSKFGVSLKNRDGLSEEFKDNRKANDVIKEINSVGEKGTQSHLAYIAYIFNFLGESYSKIVQYNNCLEDDNRKCFPDEKNLIECKRLALNYCLLAVTAAEQGNCKREVYHRNYGCAIERVFSKEPDDNEKKYNGKPYLEAAIDQYKAALKLDSNERIYHCLTSAYNKIFKEECNLQKGAAKSLSGEEKQKGKNFFTDHKDYEALIKQYLACYPNRADAHASALLYYRNQYLVDSSKVSAEEIKYHSNTLGLLLPKEKVTNENEAYADGQAILEELERLEKLEAEKKLL